MTSTKKLQITSYYHFRKIVLFTRVTVLLFFFNVQHWQIDLKVSGDASINPGPTYAADEALLGSFHQDHERFGYTSSILCDGNLLCAMC